MGALDAKRKQISFTVFINCTHAAMKIFSLMRIELAPVFNIANDVVQAFLAPTAISTL